MLRMYTDASTKNNPGPSGAGIVLIADGLHEQLAIPLKGELSNHEAEFEALMTGLMYLSEHNYTNQSLLIFSDSKIVVTAIEHKYVKNKVFQAYLTSINQLLRLFPSFMIQWIPEYQNKEADHLARQGLNKHMKSRH